MALFVDPELREQINEICIIWDGVEEKIKYSERITNEVSLPSINELRYAGRRLIDALNISFKDEISAEDKKEFYSFLLEAKHFCVRAEHDAIDSIVLFIDSRLNEIIREFGIVLINQVFPKFSEMKKKINDANHIITRSRKERDSRTELYNDIFKSLSDGLLDMYNDLLISEEIIKAHIEEVQKKEKKDKLWHIIQLVIGYGIGVIGIIVGIIGYI